MFMSIFFLIGVILLILIWTQLVVPLWKGETLFPIITPAQQMEGDLAKEKGLTEELKIKKEIEQEKQRRQNV